MRGARSISDLRSRSARETANSSSALPPEYMTATTIAARFSLSASAPIMERSATASTPSRPARKSRTIEATSPTITGTAPAAQTQCAIVWLPDAHATPPADSAASAIAISARGRSLSRTRLIGAPRIGYVARPCSGVCLAAAASRSASSAYGPSWTSSDLCAFCRRHEPPSQNPSAFSRA